MAIPTRRMWLLAVALVANSLLLGGTQAGEAFACSCAGEESTEEAFQRADAVFSGEMVRGGIEDPDPEDDTMIGGIQFRVLDAWKGVPGESVVLYGQEAAYYGKLEEGEMVVASSCAYTFEEGESYLVYASRQEDGLQTGLCDRTMPLTEAERDLDVLGPPADRLTETGGPPLPFAGVLAAVAAFWISCAVLHRWVRP